MNIVREPEPMDVNQILDAFDDFAELYETDIVEALESGAVPHWLRRAWQERREKVIEKHRSDQRGGW